MIELDQQIIEKMNQILATSQDHLMRHMAHRTSHYAHRRLMERISVSQDHRYTPYYPINGTPKNKTC